MKNTKQTDKLPAPPTPCHPLERKIFSLVNELGSVHRRVDALLFPNRVRSGKSTRESEFKTVLNKVSQNPEYLEARRKLESLRVELLRVRDEYIKEVGAQEQRKPDYYEYLNSPEWKKKSRAAKRREEYRCQLCYRHQDEVQLDAHHRTYERLGHEKPTDIVVLCHDCHGKFHNKLP